MRKFINLLLIISSLICVMSLISIDSLADTEIEILSKGTAINMFICPILGILSGILNIEGGKQ